MPFWQIGRSNCRFREVSRKPTSEAVIAATKRFPELADLSWPERGSAAELRSLLYQANAFKRSERPSNLEDACQKLLGRYPVSKPNRCFRTNEWSFDDVYAEVSKKAKSTEINRDASPGVPLSRLNPRNGELLDRHLDFVCLCVTERLFRLASVELDQINALTPQQLIERGLCDPVRLFVKQEPHPKRKTDVGKVRLISSVSIVDQLVERMLFGPQNQLEIAEWDKIPSKPGMGLSVEAQASTIFSDLAFKHRIQPAAEADISGFDWSVQDWELWADVEMRVVLGRMPNLLAKVAKNRFACFMNSVFQLSDGTLIEQGLPGLMKSGSYCTSSTNSRIRCLMAELIGSPWCIAMGDDSVEGYLEDSAKKYALLGHVCKDYKPCLVNSEGDLYEVDFCSHKIRKDECYLTSWPKTLFRFLHAEGQWEDLKRELGTSPMWPKIQGYFGQETPSTDKRRRVKHGAKPIVSKSFEVPDPGDTSDASGEASTSEAKSPPQENVQTCLRSAEYGFCPGCYVCYTASQTAPFYWGLWDDVCHAQ
uniref:RNA-directed RNA polymerase n=1 Tax=Soybean thrips sobemo-like virus 11 TaxID=2801035 RepID=A0A7T8E835_9VIRU|nr:polyprotein P2ab [Soybean thrips sobemo-like virus 11]